jgi:uncharacterized protein
MNIKRLITPRLKSLLRSYPAVALVGPRQAGKTTLARSLGKRYFDLEQDGDRLKLDLEWHDLKTSSSLVVLDEAQSYPEAFHRLRGAIDSARRKNGRFLILGSVSPSLMREVSESLAGRLALCELTPFLATEVKRRSLDGTWLRGGFPDGGALTPGHYPEWQAHYLRLLAERDLPQWGLPAKPQMISRMFKMLAASQAGLWNASDLARSLGLSYHTVSSYLDYLEGAYLIRRLMPFHGNMRKRLVKSPKIYWRDSGLLHALLGSPTAADLRDRPWVGASWEGFVIEQILGNLAARGIETDPSFFRTSDGHEIDLVLELRGKRWAIEVKLSSAPKHADIERLSGAAEMIGADRAILVSRTPSTVSGPLATSTNLSGAVRILVAAGS